MLGKAILFTACFALALASEVALALPPGVCDPNQPISAAQIFAENCASCHGANATGGKASSQKPAPDLTILKRDAKGVFPGSRVADAIRFGRSRSEHGGDRRMAIWAKVFHAECGPAYSRRAVVKLTKYIEELQK